MMMLQPRRGREGDAKGRPRSGGGREVDLAVVALHHHEHGGEPESRALALGLGGDEGLEDRRLDVWGMPARCRRSRSPRRPPRAAELTVRRPPVPSMAWIALTMRLMRAISSWFEHPQDARQGRLEPLLQDAPRPSGSGSGRARGCARSPRSGETAIISSCEGRLKASRLWARPLMRSAPRGDRVQHLSLARAPGPGPPAAPGSP